jgi:four helix bundle protein
MSEQADRLKERTFRFALDVIQLTRTFSSEEPGPTVRRQLTKAATSVGANYRAACRARSHADFTSRISVVAEEADESAYWLDVTAGATLTTAAPAALEKLQQESRELTAIFSRAGRDGLAKRREKVNRVI